MAVKIERYPDGNIYKKIEYTNNKRDRVETHYNSNGGIFVINTFKNNKMHGVQKVFRDGGGLMMETPYVNDMPHGVSILYDKDGSIKGTITYEKGKEVNIQKFEKRGLSSIVLQQKYLQAVKGLNKQWKNYFLEL